MKKIFIVFALLMTIASCSSNNDPVEVIKDFTKAFEAKDFNKAASYATKEYKQKILDMKDYYGESKTMVADEYTYTLVKNEDGFAEVNIEEKKHKYLPLKPYTTFFLKKEKGKWYIYTIQATK
jgi:hypothetical protein